jgi:hypothetical protein
LLLHPQYLPAFLNSILRFSRFGKHFVQHHSVLIVYIVRLNWRHHNMKNITPFGLWLMADVQRVRFLLLALTALALILMVVVGTASHSLLIAGPATGGSGGTG